MCDQKPAPHTVRYAHAREIARGGMGRVSRVTDQSLDRPVAMKVLMDRGSDRHKARFIREAMVLARLEHPNIVPIHDLGRTGEGSVFYTMKLVKGETLQSIINRIKGGEPEAIRQYTLSHLLLIFRKVCDAMAFSHEQGVIHRDLKPDNIMVGAFGEVLVMDWGLAKVGKAFPSIIPDPPAADPGDPTIDARDECSDETVPDPDDPERTLTLEDLERTLTLHEVGPGDTLPDTASLEARGAAPFGEDLQDAFDEGPDPDRLTRVGTVMGTPQFMPPEQARGDVAQLDARSDIYSLGAILYNMLALRAPVEGETLDQVLSDVIEGNIPPPTSRTPHDSASPPPSPGRPTSRTEQGVRLAHCPGNKIPPALSAVAMRALATEPDGRYQGVGDLISDLDAYEGGYATSVEDVGVLGQLRLFARRNRVLSASAAVLFLLSAGFVVKLMDSERRAVRSASDATREASLARTAEQSARQAQTEARAAEAAAKSEQERTRRALGKATIALADAAWMDGDAVTLTRLLSECPADLRDTTWRYLDRKIHAPARSFPDLEGGVAFYPGSDTRAPAFVARNNRDEFVFLGVDGTQQGTVGPDGTSRPVRTGIFSPDGTRMAVVGEDIRLVDPGSGEELRRFACSFKPEALEFTADGKSLMVKSRSRTLHLLDANSGEERWSIKGPGRGSVGSFALDPTGAHAAVYFVHAKHEVRLVDLTSGELLRKLEPGNSFVWDLEFSRDGTLLAAGDINGYATIWNVDKGHVRTRLHTGTGQLRNLAFLRDNHLVTLVREHKQSDAPRRLQLWEVSSGTELDRRVNVPTTADYMAVDPGSGSVFVSGPPAMLFHFPLPVPTIEFETTFPAPVGFLGDRYLFSGARKKRGYGLHDLRQPDAREEAWHLDTGLANLHLAVDPLRHRLLVGNNDHRERNPFRRVVLTPAGLPEDEPAPALAFTARATCFARTLDQFAFFGRTRKGLENRGVVMDWKTSEPLFELEAPEGTLCSGVDFLDEDRKIVGVFTVSRKSAPPGTLLLCWDHATRKPTHRINVANEAVVFAGAPDGSRFALTGRDKSITIHDARTLEPTSVFRTHDADVTAIAFHPTRPVIASASADLSIKLWNTRTGEPLGTILGPKSKPVSIAFSPSGDLLACSSHDNKTRVWTLDRLGPLPDAGHEARAPHD